MRVKHFSKKRIISFVAAVCLLLLSSFFIPSFRGTILTILKFPIVVSNSIRSEILALINHHLNFVRNQELKKEVDQLKKELIQAKEFAIENERLKGLLSFKQRSAYKLLAARVIARSPDNWSSLAMIDKGFANGIKRGAIAVSALGLAGRVVEVSKWWSKVMLINDPNLAVSSIDQRSRQEGLVTGTLGGNLIMKYLPAEADIEVSDLILTSGLSIIYPKGLLIGSVVSVGNEFSGLSRYAIIKPAVNLSNLEEVLIIIP